MEQKSPFSFGSLTTGFLLAVIWLSPIRFRYHTLNLIVKYDIVLLAREKWMDVTLFGESTDIKPRSYSLE